MIKEHLPAAGLALALSLASCSNEASAKHEVSPTVATESPSPALSLEEQQLQAYQNKYGECPTSITFSFGQKPKAESAHGETIAFVDNAGAISLAALYNALTEKQKRDILAHELTHACTDNGEILNSVVFSEGVITGVRGFNLDVTTKAGVDTKFSLIDEAASEVLANHLQEDYHTDEQYARLGNLLLDMMEQMQMSAEQLAELHASNDLVGLMSQYYSIPRQNVSARHFENFMLQFQSVYTPE